MPRSASFESRAVRRCAFTLIELLIVIAIISILIVLGVAVASKVTGTGKAKLTEQTLRALDTALTAYISDKGMPPPWIVDPRETATSNQKIWPVADAVNSSSGSEPINSVGLFMLQCKDVPSANTAIRQLDPKQVRDYDPDAPGNNNSASSNQPQIPTAIDGWGNPIRYVHPMLKGGIYGPTYPSNMTDPTSAVMVTDVLGTPAGKTWAIQQFRRNNSVTTGATMPPDSDGGMNSAARPYFYSLGPDGKAGFELGSGNQVVNDFNADNIYLTKPRFHKP